MFQKYSTFSRNITEINKGEDIANQISSNLVQKSMGMLS